MLLASTQGATGTCAVGGRRGAGRRRAGGGIFARQRLDPLPVRRRRQCVELRGPGSHEPSRAVGGVAREILQQRFVRGAEASLAQRLHRSLEIAAAGGFQADGLRLVTGENLMDGHHRLFHAQHPHHIEPPARVGRQTAKRGDHWLRRGDAKFELTWYSPHFQRAPIIKFMRLRSASGRG
jgi:hypothetical protein